MVYLKLAAQALEVVCTYQINAHMTTVPGRITVDTSQLGFRNNRRVRHYRITDIHDYK